MAFSLIDDDVEAVPITVLSKGEFETWREQVSAPEREWLAATGFSAEPGKMSLVPDEQGRLGRVLVGTPDEGSAMWGLAGLSETLPPGAYRLGGVPEAVFRSSPPVSKHTPLPTKVTFGAALSPQTMSTRRGARVLARPTAWIVG